MNVIAKTSSGVLIEATEEEVKGILKATINSGEPKVEIGTKLPAHDYAEVIKRCKSFKTSDAYVFFKSRMRDLDKYATKLTDAIDNLDFDGKP